MRALLGVILLLTLSAPAWGGWLDGWTYRKAHTITGSADGTLTDYQIEIDVYRSTGTDSGSTVYVGTAAKTDFSDIRFTGSDETTAIVHGKDKTTHGAITTHTTFLSSASCFDASGNLYYGNGAGLYKTASPTAAGTLLKTFTGASHIRTIYVAANGYIYVSAAGGTMSADDSGVWRSTNGTDFVQVHAFGNALNFLWGMDEDANGNLYAAVYTGGATPANDKAQVIKSVNNGGSFTVAKDFTADSQRHMHGISVDKATGYVYITLGDKLTTDQCKRSTDGGTTWTAITGIPQSVGVLATPTSRLFGTDDQNSAAGRIYRTTNDSTITNVLEVDESHVFWIRRNPTTGNIYAAFVGTDSGATKFYVSSLWVSDDDGVTWTRVRNFACHATNGDYDGPQFASANFYNNQLVMGVYLNGVEASTGILTDIAHAKFTLKIPSIVAGANTVYMYYGNNAASSAADNDSAFLFYDDFTAGSIDTNKWSNVVDVAAFTTSQAQGRLRILAAAYSGGAATVEAYKSVAQYAGNFKVVYEVEKARAAVADNTAGGTFSFGAYTQDAAGLPLEGLYAAVAASAGKNNNGYYVSRKSSTSNFFGSDDTQRHGAEITLKYTPALISTYRNDIADSTYNTAANIATAPFNISIRANTAANAAVQSYDLIVDAVKVMKTTTNEPTSTAWGTEEQPVVQRGGRQSGVGFNSGSRLRGLGFNF